MLIRIPPAEGVTAATRPTAAMIPVNISGPLAVAPRCAGRDQYASARGTRARALHSDFRARACRTYRGRNLRAPWAQRTRQARRSTHFEGARHSDDARLRRAPR